MKTVFKWNKNINIDMKEIILEKCFGLLISNWELALFFLIYDINVLLNHAKW